MIDRIVRQVDHGDSEPDPPLAVETRVANFRIRGLLGEGAMGQVYLAQDTVLGRRVALKLIKRSVMQGDGLAQFLEEARATARFNHPHIVTLHAFGEFEGRPYLALEYLDGETLRERIAAGPLSLQEALRYGRAVADALAEAHRHGLVHADLKPENIVIPRDGRVRVVDFGLAKLVGDSPTAASGTPAYMAPERWRGSPPTGAIDVWALGITLHELITGHRPFPDRELATLAFASETPAIAGLPATTWAALVRDCLVADPARRPSAEEVVRRLAALLDPRTVTDEDHVRSPYPGLASFTREHAADYFGRKAELDTLLEQLRLHPLVPIVGPSGIGKSSFVRAAVVPRLEETGAWLEISFRPGAAPFEQLAAALAAPDRPVREIATLLRRHPDTLTLLLDELARRRGARVLMFIDQFEETFTLAAADSLAFCDCLGRAAMPGEPWRIVLTLRDDFLGRLAESAHLRPHLGAVIPLGPLSASDLRAAVLGPLAHAGYEPDAPELAARIVEDVQHQPACLPLLQFTCQTLWERRDVASRHILTREYDAIGGATGALATHAERLLSELSTDQIRLARAILLALVNPDGTRRPRFRGELVEVLPAGADAVIERLLERRLVVATRDPEHESARIEVAHEALATAWPQLARWLDETYEERLLAVELEQASTLWQRRGRRDDETWGGAALGEAMRKVGDWNISLPSLSRSFLEAGLRRERRLRLRRAWLFASVLGGLGAIALAAVIAAVAFSRKEQQALRQQRLIQLAASDLGKLRLELEPYDWDPRSQRTIPPAVRPHLTWRLLAEDPEREHTPGAAYVEGRDVRRGAPRWSGHVLVEEIEARSGPAYLEVSGRGGRCPPSVVFLRRLPGYTERAAARVFRIQIPTCAASTVDTIEIPAGEFYRSDYQPDGEGPFDTRVAVPRFAIDRTEVTRGAFAPYDALEPLTGDGAVGQEYVDVDPERDRLPVVGVSFQTARNFCRYLGKELPTMDQWQKAFRGGVAIQGAPNPEPLRSTPWGTANSAPSANIDNEQGTGELVPVGSFPDDASPYGVMDLAGSVSEWVLTNADLPRIRGLRTVLGSNWGTPWSLGHHLITWRNARSDRFLDFAIGIRCVAND